MKSKRVYLGKGLTTAQAWKKLIAKRSKLPDFRGMKYVKSTGWATVI